MYSTLLSSNHKTKISHWQHFPDRTKNQLMQDKQQKIRTDIFSWCHTTKHGSFSSAVITAHNPSFDIKCFQEMPHSKSIMPRTEPVKAKGDRNEVPGLLEPAKTYRSLQLGYIHLALSRNWQDEVQRFVLYTISDWKQILINIAAEATYKQINLRCIINSRIT